MKIIKILSVLMLGIWFSGAGLMAAAYEIERKSECIDREGLIKGIFWCKTDPISNSEITSHIIASFLRGLKWPAELFAIVMDGKINQYFSKNSNIPEEFRDYYYSIPPEFRIPEEYVQSHEYIKAAGYGENWVSTEKNNYKLWLPQTGEYGFKQYFQLGSGECEKYLAGVPARKVSLMMKGVNYTIRSEPNNNDIPIMYTKLQCVAYEGTDQECEKKFNATADEIINLYNETSLGKEELLQIKSEIMRFKIFKVKDFCEIRKVIGQERIFSISNPNELK